MFLTFWKLFFIFFLQHFYICDYDLNCAKSVTTLLTSCPYQLFLANHLMVENKLQQAIDKVVGIGLSLVWCLHCCMLNSKNSLLSFRWELLHLESFMSDMHCWVLCPSLLSFLVVFFVQMEQWLSAILAVCTASEFIKNICWSLLVYVGCNALHGSSCITVEFFFIVIVHHLTWWQQMFKINGFLILFIKANYNYQETSLIHEDFCFTWYSWSHFYSCNDRFNFN